MRADARGVASALALGAAIASFGYTIFAVTRVLAFARRVDAQRERTRAASHGVSAAEDARLPSTTVLKPVRGVEPGLAGDLASFCAQDYPAFDVVLGTLDPNDPAAGTLHAVASAGGERVRVVAGDGVPRHRNPKMSTLAPMLPFASGEILVIADSDMRVTPDYLRAVAAAFADPAVGAVTCVYRGEPRAPGIAPALGALWISEQFLPSVLVARIVEPMTYCFGGTMAVRRDVFDAIGGVDVLGRHLADDHALGYLVAASGRRVALADYVVSAGVHDATVGGLLRHELRWARTIRSLRPASYAGVAIGFPVPLAVAALCLARDRRIGSVVLAAATLARLALHAAVRRVGGPPLPAWLIPLRDALGVGVWLGGFIGTTVRWRGAVLSTRTP